VDADEAIDSELLWCEGFFFPSAIVKLKSSVSAFKYAREPLSPTVVPTEGSDSARWAKYIDGLPISTIQSQTWSVQNNSQEVF
jgi:hypothetical protein